MAINRLQIRRDSLADFQTAALSPEGGEPQYIVEEKRIRIGDAKGTHVSRQQLVAPTVEGSQFHGLWNVRSFGTGKCIDVPVSNGSYAGGEGTLDAQYFVATGALPGRSLRDAGIAYVSASGDFLPGSTDPAMIFRFEVGSVEGGGTQIKPRSGKNPVEAGSYPTAEIGGLEISGAAGYSNCLGDYNKPVIWDLDAKVCFLGRDSISPFRTSLGSSAAHDSFTFRERSTYGDELVVPPAGSPDDDIANVRVYGTLTVQDPFEGYANSRSSISSDTQQSGYGGSFGAPPYSELAGGRPYGIPDLWNRGAVRVANGNSFEAMGDVPCENWDSIRDLAGASVSDVNTKVERLCNAMTLNGSAEPGAGRYAFRYWRPKKTVVHFSFEEFVPDADSDDLVLHLKVGGPMQSDPGVVYPELEAGLNQSADDWVGVYANSAMRYTNNGAGAGLRALLSRLGVTPDRYDQDNSVVFADVDSGKARVGRQINGVDYACRVPHVWNQDSRYNSDPAQNSFDKNELSGYWYYQKPTKKTVNLTTGDAGDTWEYSTGTEILSIGEEPSVNWLVDQFIVGEQVAFEINNDSVQGTGFVASGSTAAILQIENISWGGSGEPANTGTSARTAAAGFVETLAADADGEWNCAWRRLPDDRRDRMRIHHTTAFFFGGRPGINDYRSV